MKKRKTINIKNPLTVCWSPGPVVMIFDEKKKNFIKCNHFPMKLQNEILKLNRRKKIQFNIIQNKVVVL